MHISVVTVGMPHTNCLWNYVGTLKFYPKMNEFYLSAKLPQNGAAKNSTKGLEPISKPHCPGFIPICLKYTPINGNNEPNAE